VQLEIATHPLLVKQLQIPVIDVLQEALESHRYALSINQDNTDALFNTSQVLTSIAEEYAKDDHRPDQDALQPLEEALELQSRCLSLQELELEEALEYQNALARQGASPLLDAESLSTMDAHDEDHDQDGGGGNGEDVPVVSAEEDKWFSIVEPVTKDTLIDTILAQLGTLTTLCGILSSSTTSAPSSSLAWVEEYSSKLLNEKLPSLANDATAERLQEAALTRAIFVSSLLEAGYRLSKIDAETYKRERDAAFHTAELKLEHSSAALIANANSLMAYSAALGEADNPTLVSAPTSAPTSGPAARWSALSAASTNLTAASKLPSLSAEETVQTHLLRGNCSLLQYQLGHPPSVYQPAVANGAQLLKNADIFYRNAAKLSRNGDPGTTAIAEFRAGVVQALQQGHGVSGDVAAVAAARSLFNQSRGPDWVRGQIDDMVNEGLLPSTEAD